ncbi:hypothetical protein Syun_014392 [Stephania yunnanensis]|uniref:Uncharacterized protein n=1 Tax=Stephania yunnanensis TaxID=152371 RepID=A0AAP0JLK5_9MAGN
MNKDLSRLMDRELFFEEMFLQVLPFLLSVLHLEDNTQYRENAKVAMQGYLNHFLGNMDIANSREVWAVLKPGFLALLEDPFDTKLLDIIVFDVFPAFVNI